VSLPLRDGVGRRIRLETSSTRETAGPETEDHGSTANPDDGIILLLVDWTFGTEPLSAISSTLTQVGTSPAASLHPDTAERLGLADEKRITLSTGGAQLSVSLQVDPRMAPGVMVMPRHQQLDWQRFDDTRVMLEGSQVKAD
jgi:hypothetical protein